MITQLSKTTTKNCYVSVFYRAPGCSPAAEERMQGRAGEVSGQCKYMRIVQHSEWAKHLLN